MEAVPRAGGKQVGQASQKEVGELVGAVCRQGKCEKRTGAVGSEIRHPHTLPKEFQSTSWSNPSCMHHATEALKPTCLGGQQGKKKEDLDLNWQAEKQLECSLTPGDGFVLNGKD